MTARRFAWCAGQSSVVDHKEHSTLDIRTQMGHMSLGSECPHLLTCHHELLSMSPFLLMSLANLRSQILTTQPEKSRLLNCRYFKLQADI